MELPMIRQVAFKIDSNRVYRFDVNQTVTIKALKKIIVAAGGLPKKDELKIIHKDIDYTQDEDATLQELFPSIELIELTTSLEKPTRSENKSKIKLRLGDYCNTHNYKFLCFYCFNCQKSLCSLCIQDPSHKLHNVLEKYDYLQNSRHLVDLIFKDVNKFIPDLKLDKSEDADELKKRVSENYFPTFHEMLLTMETKILEIIDLFKETSDMSLKNIHKNVTLIKEHGAYALDKLKEEISIENIILREDTFLTFDKKYNELSNEQYRLALDSAKYNELNMNFQPLSEMVEFVYNDLYKFLDEKLNMEMFTRIKKKIEDTTVNLISREEIVLKLLSEIRGLQTPKKRTFISPSAFTTEETRRKDMSPMNEIIEDLPRYVMSYAEGTKEVVMFDDMNNTIQVAEIDFPQLCGISTFLKNSASCNYKGKIYISGGQIDQDTNSTSFVMYIPNQNSLLRLPDMISPRMCHSILAHEDGIYAVGGFKINTCEKYDVHKLEWIKMNNLNSEERQYPMLHIFGHFLYAFFGYTNGSYTDSVEKIDILNIRAPWQIVPYKNQEKIDLKIVGCGIIPSDEYEIYFFGGKTKNEIKSDSFRFNSGQNAFIPWDGKLEQPAYFLDSSLIYLGGQSYGHFAADSGLNFIKLVLG